MSMSMEVSVFLAYAFGALMVYIAGKFLLLPLKWILICCVNSIIGGAVIILLNCVGAAFNFFVPLNLITAAITGVLGVPGIALLWAIFS